MVVSDSDDNGPQCPAMAEKNEMQKMWNSRMAVASMIPNVTILILNGVFGHRLVIADVEWAQGSLLFSSINIT